MLTILFQSHLITNETLFVRLSGVNRDRNLFVSQFSLRHAFDVVSDFVTQACGHVLNQFMDSNLSLPFKKVLFTVPRIF